MSGKDRWAKRREQGWPMFSFSGDLMAGAMEVGRDLYALGAFGGFGGYLGPIYPELEWAIEEARKHNADPKMSRVCVYKISCDLVKEHP